MTVYDGAVYVSSPYGWRNHPITGVRSHHNGKDMVAQAGKNQRLVVPKGVVLQVNIGYNGGRGNNVLIQSTEDTVRPGHDVRLRYQHQSGTALRVGQVLAEGDIVGVEGSTGDSTGSHCHFEVTVDGAVVDPSPWDGLPNAVGLYPATDGGGAQGGRGGQAAGGKTKLEVFTPGKNSRLEVFSKPDVSATAAGGGGTKRWPERDYIVYETAALAGIPGLEGVLLRAEGGFGWAAKLAGKYGLRTICLAEAVAAGLLDDGTGVGGLDQVKATLSAGLTDAKATLAACRAAAEDAERTLRTLEGVI